MEKLTQEEEDFSIQTPTPIRLLPSIFSFNPFLSSTIKFSNSVCEDWLSLPRKHSAFCESPSLSLHSTSLLNKTCKCSRSRCLKLYCECFSIGEFCSNCDCKNCLNTPKNAEERGIAIKMIKHRNPRAFENHLERVEIGSEIEFVNFRGCNCSKSACLKKYCECFLRGVKCSGSCRCIGCKN